MSHQTSQRSHCRRRGKRHTLQGLIRPNDSQGDVADGPQRGGAAVLGGTAAQEDPEVRIQGHWADRAQWDQNIAPRVNEVAVQASCAGQVSDLTSHIRASKKVKMRLH